MQARHSSGLGPGGNCLCPKCGKIVPHNAGTPCNEEKCPSCGSKMLREGSYHHELLKRKKGDINSLND